MFYIPVYMRKQALHDYVALVVRSTTSSPTSARRAGFTSARRSPHLSQRVLTGLLDESLMCARRELIVRFFKRNVSYNQLLCVA